MIRDNIDNLIIYLMVLNHYAKDLHYNCKGDNFYGNHLFADKLGNFDEQIDLLKEVCLLGHKLEPLKSAIYMSEASKLIPSEINFKKMHELCLKVLTLIESMQNLSKGDENLIGGIAQDVQQNIGLLNIMFGGNK